MKRRFFFEFSARIDGAVEIAADLESEARKIFHEKYEDDIEVLVKNAESPTLLSLAVSEDYGED